MNTTGVWMKSTLLVLLMGVGLCGSVSGGAEPAAAVRFRQTFETPGEQDAWSGWSVGQPVRIEAATPGWQSPTCLRFSVRKRGWDTAIVHFDPPVTISERTMVRMRLRADRPGPYGMNIRSRTEGAEYFLPFPIADSGWVRVHKYLSGTVYKRVGKPDVPKDGLVGDEVGSIQIAYAGSQLEIDDFEIVDVAPGVPEVPLATLPGADGYEPHPYPILDRVFPFGVILTVSAGDAGNGALFGQSRDERFTEDLLDIRRHHMNAVSNFCDDGRIAWRLSQMRRHKLHLVETRFANADLSRAPQTGPPLETIRTHRDDPWLLAWYGRDEPTDLQHYLANKRAIMACDPNHPVASAFNEMYTAKALGPFMELIMIDPYSVLPGARRVDAIAFHGDLIRNARGYCAGNRVWLIAQTFSNRMGRAEVLRMPDAVEMRFEVFNALAAGVDGLFFFIYHDTCTYLDGRIRSEEFDDTLVDPWGNPSPAYTELSRLGRMLVPTVTVLRGLAWPPSVVPGPRPAGLTLGRLDLPEATCVMAVNQDLDSAFDGSLDVEALPAGRVHDLLSLQPIDRGEDLRVPLHLEPGGGAILATMPPEAWPGLRAAVLRRRVRREHELLGLEADVLRRAGIGTATASEGLEAIEARLGDGSPEDLLGRLGRVRRALAEAERSAPAYAATRDRLGAAQAAFGEVHRRVRPHIGTLDASKQAAWVAFCQRLTDLSRRYFAVRRAWRKGDCSRASELDDLVSELTELRGTDVRRLAVPP